MTLYSRRRIERELLCIGLAFLLIMLMPHNGLKSISTPIVQAQEGGAIFAFSDLQFDGSRYYYPCSVIAGYITVDWRMYLADNINYIVNEIAPVSINVDSSEFFVEPGGCIGFGDCATRCNACVTGYRNNCKLIAIGAATVAGITFLASFACAIGAAATIVGIGIAFLCGAAAGAVLAGTGLIIKGQYETCKAAAVNACNASNPGCNCAG